MLFGISIHLAPKEPLATASAVVLMSCVCCVCIFAGFPARVSLCGFSRSVLSSHHGINTLLLRHLGEGHQAGAVAEEFAVEEGVHQVHLANDVHQTEQLAEEVPVHVHVVRLWAKGAVVNKCIIQNLM